LDGCALGIENWKFYGNWSLEIGALVTICLVMIVKNEAAVIDRCLASVREFIDCWVICDTGSTDRTREIIRESLSGIPGTLHDVPWENFGRNRTTALALARGKADYHLLLDADMTLSVAGEFRESLTESAYLVRYTGPMDYWVERLLSDRHEWEFVGPAHEYIRSTTGNTRAKLPGLTVTHHGDGGCQRGKIERYLALLKQAHEEDPENPRHVFYIAQSYGDLGNFPQAIEWHEKRATMGSWEEEVWYSLYQIARLQHRMGYAWPLVLDAYLRAYQYRPTRIEPIFHIAKFYRENGQYHLGHLFARAAIDAPYPDDLLFIEKSVYDFELTQEYAACRQQIGEHHEANRVNDAIIA
jgi:glycosyltransferase involved in cell wall biosynthesis